MWYETALQQIGLEKNLELDISLVPHTERPDHALNDMREALLKMGRNSSCSAEATQDKRILRSPGGAK
jgi:hypothetical protein